ncbi:TetR/AcrR family transcriptional regulator [Nocardiopsis sp. HNM0947]|uniref:TetR/AcrR family transcriptional regulator n=1 Tax=Nocardiopsis coralli TaxID=2772213 RepID=A0ABR9NZZ0_9ACTN|nr:TetR/AcrR family transcriptional regulator [Nocardiopsis coralli]MBE2997147.1 TetR/AcrR family transcriptional regulator [Nocardiopsis coralli]
MSGRGTRSDRAVATQQSILAAAEQLFAEHGVANVSNRQIGLAAGQGNNTAVSYHFGSRSGLIRAIVRAHTEQIESIRLRMVEQAEGSTATRDWVACMVEPFALHLADLGVPSWFARFSAQVMSDPSHREAVARESLNSPSLTRAVEEVHRCLPDLPEEIRLERQDMTRQLMIHMIAEREDALANGRPTSRGSWHRAAAGLTDAVTGLWSAPVSTGASDMVPEGAVTGGP